MHSISDLMAFCRKTTGDVPAKLVGASTTVAGSKMYLFGGRLASERRMVSDLYVFDMESYVWECIPAHADDDVPGARYFHSAEHWNNHLVIFGGMGSNPNATSPSEDLCVLNDVRFFDLASRRWLPASSTSIVSEKASPPTSPSSPSSNDGEDLTPKARYAHLSAITSDRMFIIGGQDVANIWMDEVYVYDLVQRRWAQRREYPRHCGSYRSIAVASEWRVRLPEQEQQEQQRTRAAMVMGSTTATENKFTNVGAGGATATTPPESLVHMPYSARPTEEFPNDILLYSNHNFTDVKREFDAIRPLPTGGFIVDDRSQDITGTNFPPGLRFPSGAVLGTHLIVAGTYLAQTYQSFSIWALNLLTLTWTRIEAGSAISPNGGSSSGGSWFRAVVHARANQLLVFGDRRGNLVDDYNKRLLCWDDVVVVDLEASGIYQPPPRALAPHAQQLGLSALEQGVLADFEIVCDDGRAVACSRKVLEERWPWFREQRRRFTERALGAAAETLSAVGATTTTGASAVANSIAVPLPDVAGPAHEKPRPDPRLTPRSLALSEPYPITLALVQYFYTLALTTPLQHAPAVLSQLLILANTYGLAHLEALVKHAMHRALSDANSVGVYEVATLCSCRSLQIRALNTVMAYSQGRRGANANRSGRGDRDQQQRDHRNGGGGGSNSGGSGGGGVYINGASTSGGGGGSTTTPDAGAAVNGTSSSGGSARPRGMSDAPFRSVGGGGGGVLAVSAVAMRHGGNMSNGT